MLLTLLVSGAGVGRAADCSAGVANDYNGDGFTDVAVGQPGATVDGKPNAGAIWVFYGGGKGSQRLVQGGPGVGGTAEAGDRFGEVLVTDNSDACSLLIVGVPAEDVNSATDAGAVHVIHGAPAGLGAGEPATVHRQGAGGYGGAAEAGDRFGTAIALGIGQRTGERVIVTGVPGEDLGGTVDAGAIHYRIGGAPVAFVTQDSAGVPGVAEAGDRFGAAVGAGMSTLVVGAPGEDLGSVRDAGAAYVFAHGNPRPRARASISQASAGVGGSAEAGDAFGAAVAVSPRVLTPDDPSRDADWVAIGVPGENVGSIADAGLVHVALAGATSTSRHRDITQNGSGVEDFAEPGDRFGSVLHLPLPARFRGGTVNAPLLAVGAPAETRGGAGGAGLVQVFHLGDASLGGRDVVLGQGLRGIAGVPEAGDAFGAAVSSTPHRLLVGTPGQRNGAGLRTGIAYGIPWTWFQGGSTPDDVSWPGPPEPGGTFGRAIG